MASNKHWTAMAKRAQEEAVPPQAAAPEAAPAGGQMPPAPAAPQVAEAPVDPVALGLGEVQRVCELVVKRLKEIRDVGPEGAWLSQGYISQSQADLGRAVELLQSIEGMVDEAGDGKKEAGRNRLHGMVRYYRRRVAGLRQLMASLQTKRAAKKVTIDTTDLTAQAIEGLTSRLRETGGTLTFPTEDTIVVDSIDDEYLKNLQGLWPIKIVKRRQADLEDMMRKASRRVAMTMSEIVKEIKDDFGYFDEKALKQWLEENEARLDDQDKEMVKNYMTASRRAQTAWESNPDMLAKVRDLLDSEEGYGLEEIADILGIGLDEAKEMYAEIRGKTGARQAEKVSMECLECGAVFSKNITGDTYEVKCPKCGGYDTDLAKSGSALESEIRGAAKAGLGTKQIASMLGVAEEIVAETVKQK